MTFSIVQYYLVCLTKDTDGVAIIKQTAGLANWAKGREISLINEDTIWGVSDRGQLEGGELVFILLVLGSFISHQRDMDVTHHRSVLVSKP